MTKTKLIITKHSNQDVLNNFIAVVPRIPTKVGDLALRGKRFGLTYGQVGYILKHNKNITKDDNGRYYNSTPVRALPSDLTVPIPVVETVKIDATSEEEMIKILKAKGYRLYKTTLSEV